MRRTMLPFKNDLWYFSLGGILFLSFVIAVPHLNEFKRANREEYNATNMVAVNGPDNYWCAQKSFILCRASF